MVIYNNKDNSHNDESDNIDSLHHINNDDHIGITVIIIAIIYHLCMLLSPVRQLSLCHVA